MFRIQDLLVQGIPDTDVAEKQDKLWCEAQQTPPPAAT